MAHPRQAFAEALGIVHRIQAASATTPIAIHKLRGGLAVLEGSGGNVAVLSGPDGKVLVDAGIAVSRPQVATALAALGPEPVTHLINTHWHFDHTSCNEWLREASPTILAHENTRKHLLTTQRVDDWDYDFAPLPAAALPTDLMADERSLTLNKTRMALRYCGPAHTDGSIRAADANLALATDNTIVIPGHGRPVSNRTELRAFRDMLVGVRANVAALKKSGHSLEAIITARLTAAYDATWGNFVISPALFTRLVFEGT